MPAKPSDQSGVDHRRTPQQQTNEDGQALLRIAGDLRNWIEGQEVPASVLEDLARVEHIGRWLSGVKLIGTSQ